MVVHHLEVVFRVPRKKHSRADALVVQSVVSRKVSRLQRISYSKGGLKVRSATGEGSKRIRELEALVSRTNPASFVFA